MRAMRLFGGLALVLLIGAAFTGTASAQYSFTGDAAFASKYLWRGQRLTDEPVLQPAMTLGIGGFSFNAWGNMDLTDINPGLVTGDMQGRFSEIDYTFSYDYSFTDVSVGGGVIFYTFPDRFFTTTEIYGGVTFDSVPVSPSVTVYVDVDETTFGGGSAGMYLLLAAGYTFETGNDVVTGIDVSGSFAFANSGFTSFYYGLTDVSGPHDASIGVSVPFEIDDNWSASAFVNYSGLLGDDIRASQYTGPDDADTVWGGASISLSF